MCLIFFKFSEMLQLSSYTQCIGCSENCIHSRPSALFGITCNNRKAVNLINEYPSGRLPLYHFDMYRVSGWEDLYSTGYFEYMENTCSTVLVFVCVVLFVLHLDCPFRYIEKLANYPCGSFNSLPGTCFWHFALEL